MNRNVTKFGLGLATAAALLVVAAQRTPAALTSGQLLTNFASATFNLPGGANVKGEEQPGTNNVNVPNSATAWVLITDQPQLCLTLRKDAISTTGAPMASQYPGSVVCFQVSFSNCGGFSGFSVMITDTMPGNVTRAIPFAGSFWTVGAGATVQPTWSSSLGGPWYGNADAGQLSPHYMRWLINRVGMHKTGYIRYCVTIQ